MSVSTQKINPHPRIAQLEQEIADKEAERKRIRLDAIVELRKTGQSLKKIGDQVGLSHGAVHQILAVYEAGNK
jgi:hypothetical protein